MRTPFTRFMAKVGSIIMGLLAFILLGSALSGGLSVVGAICLVPACGYIAAGLAEAALTPKRRRRRATRPITAAAVPAKRQLAAPAPQLRVVQGGKHTPNHPTHVA